MRPEPRNVQNVYLTLTLFSTLAASFIWGINTLFLLDAGLSSTAAFAANAFSRSAWCCSRSRPGWSPTPGVAARAER